MHGIADRAKRRVSRDTDIIHADDLRQAPRQFYRIHLHPHAQFIAIPPPDINRTIVDHFYQPNVKPADRGGTVILN